VTFQRHGYRRFVTSHQQRGLRRLCETILLATVSSTELVGRIVFANFELGFRSEVMRVGAVDKFLNHWLQSIFVEDLPGWRMKSR
jgi:hypothetical protein